MTISLQDQARLAKAQTDFRDRVTAAVFAAAISAFQAQALVDSTKQAQRLALANAVVQQPDYATTVFAWVLVSRPVLNTEADLTDTFLNTQTTNLFDPIAQQIMSKVTP